MTLQQQMPFEALVKPRANNHLPHFSQTEDRLIEGFANLALQAFSLAHVWVLGSNFSLYSTPGYSRDDVNTHTRYAALPAVVSLLDTFAEATGLHSTPRDIEPQWLPNGLLQALEYTPADERLAICIPRGTKAFTWVVLCFNEMPDATHPQFYPAVELLRQRMAYSLETRDFIQQQELTVIQQAEEISTQLELVEKQSKEVAERFADIKDSIDYASRIQRTLLQAPESLSQLFPAGSRVLYRPKDTLSGDFYWWTRKGDCAVVVLADCTGHGVPGAMLSFLGINLLNQLALELQDFNPGQVLSLLNFRLTCTLQPDGASHKLYDGMDVAILSINLRTGLSRYSGANTGMYLMRDSTVDYLEPTRLPLAGQELPNEDNVMLREYGTIAFQLKPGDRFVISTDGVKDQLGQDDSGRTKRLGRRAFHQFLESNAHLSFAKMGILFQRLMGQWTSGEEQTDDILVIGAEFQPAD